MEPSTLGGIKVRRRQRLRRVAVATTAVAAMTATVLATPAGARFISFGDSSYAFGTPLDADGNRTVCSDGFDLLTAFTPNDSGGPFTPAFDGPTGEVEGSTQPGPLMSVYDAGLVDDYPDPFGFTTVSTSGPPGAYIFINDENVPAATLYGFAETEIVNSDTFFALDGVTKPVQGEGSTFFTPTSPLPVGEDVVIVNQSYGGFGSHRRVTVVDCSEPPVELEVEVDIRNNKIRPDRPWQRIRGVIVNDGSIDISTVDNIEVSGAHPFRTRVRDVDHDGDLDLRFWARTGHTDIMCGDTQLTVTGTVDGEPFETTVDITTKCRTNRW